MKEEGEAVDVYLYQYWTHNFFFLLGGNQDEEACKGKERKKIKRNMRKRHTREAESENYREVYEREKAAPLLLPSFS